MCALSVPVIPKCLAKTTHYMTTMHITTVATDRQVIMRGFLVMYICVRVCVCICVYIPQAPVSTAVIAPTYVGSLTPTIVLCMHTRTYIQKVTRQPLTEDTD